ncbi:MAG: C40 family peptidase [Spirochaetes bacterium]|nr:C40 family peptidase [Spirochaetota bacterium]
MLKYYLLNIILLSLLTGCLTAENNVKYVGIQTYPSSETKKRIYSGVKSSVKPGNNSNESNYYYKKYASVKREDENSMLFSGLPQNERLLRENIIKTAEKYIGVKYRYGGSSPNGFDCSGFALYVYKQNGINLPRSARNQYKSGHHIKNSQAEPGDLVFFSDKGTSITHVGIYIGNNRFIHAPSTGKSVQITEIDSFYYSTRVAGYVSFIN